MRIRAAPAMAAAALAALLAEAGCLSGPALVPQSFTIDPPAHRVSESASPGGVVLALGRVEVAPPYSGVSLVYRTGDHDLERDPYARFAAPPARMLFAAIGGYLANADFVRDVVVPGDDLRAVATVEVMVATLAGELRPGGSSAVLTVRFRVLSRPGALQTSEVLLKTYSSTLPIARATAQEVVGAWNRGLADIMAEFQTDLKGSLITARLLSPGSELARDGARRPGE